MLSVNSPNPVKDMEVYRPHGCNRWLVEKAHVKPICSFEGVSFWFVDGKWLRDTTDIDFTAGGNPRRYSYVPEDEIWVDVGMEPGDVVPTMIHELVECRHMRRGENYDDAHNKASQVEIIVRQQIPNKSTSIEQEGLSH